MVNSPERLLSSIRSEKQKSDVECDIEMRLRRSKRRILPSARFKHTNQESACDGLDLEELEAIKRDNLRLTLRSQKSCCEALRNKMNESHQSQYIDTMRDLPNCAISGEGPYNEENVYACLDENPISYQDEYFGQNDFWPSQLAPNQASRKMLREKESRLFAAQLDHLKKVADVREMGIDCGPANYEQSGRTYAGTSADRLQTKRPKRSIFTKIVNLLTPNALHNSRQVDHTTRLCMMPNKRSASSTEIEQSNDGSRQIPSCSSIYKSRTLSSKSTHNLFNNSMRFLSSSRKSINLSALNNSGTEYANGFLSSRSFMSGFLTIGRRSGAATAAALANNQKGYKFTINGGKLSKEDQLQNTLRRIYSSVDSLPSADSSSSSNLQNFNSCDGNNCPTPMLDSRSKPDGNIYSQVPNLNDCDNCIYCEAIVTDNNEISAAEGEKLQIVGKAKALVDCNPCAYDKEALVFKRGDTIDIIERHQSGTWIGRCANRVGHFKFINVVEIFDHEPQDNGTQSSGDLSNVEISYGEKMAKIDSHKLDSSGSELANDDKKSFVTKLEIKNTNSPDNLKKKSLSTHTLSRDRHKGCETNYDDQNLGDKTMMGSLEQLIAAIGLHNCRQSSRPNEIEEITKANSGDQSCLEIELASCPDGAECELSYLELLNKNGITSLDSFSSLEECSDLSRIGIVDDEHQRRLLMAAKIIRQALSAARTNFVENYCIETKTPCIEKRAKSSELEETQQVTPARHGDEKYSNQSPTRGNELTSDYYCGSKKKLEKDNQLPPKTMPIKGLADNKGREGEPIYVNLQRSTASEPSVDCGSIRDATNPASAGSSSVVDLNMNYLDTCNLDLPDESSLREQAADNDEGGVAEHQHHGCKTITKRKHETRVKLVTEQDSVSRIDKVNSLAGQERTMRGGDKLFAGETSADELDDRNSINPVDRYQIHHELGRNRFNDLTGTQDNIDHYHSYTKTITPRSRPLAITSEIANEEVVNIKHGKPAFTRGCSVRVSSRKPKKINSGLVGSRDPKRRSHGWQSTNTYRQHNSLSPAHHCSQSTCHERASVVKQSEQETCLADKTSKQFDNLLMKGDHNCLKYNEPKHVVAALCQKKSGEAISQQQQSKKQDGRHNSYHLLNPDSQIISSKSAYDLRVNFSKFLEI